MISRSARAQPSLLSSTTTVLLVCTKRSATTGSCSTQRGSTEKPTPAVRQRCEALYAAASFKGRCPASWMLCKQHACTCTVADNRRSKGCQPCKALLWPAAGSAEQLTRRKHARLCHSLVHHNLSVYTHKHAPVPFMRM
jgi:hypothetical protein